MEVSYKQKAKPTFLSKSAMHKFVIDFTFSAGTLPHTEDQGWWGLSWAELRPPPLVTWSEKPWEVGELITVLIHSKDVFDCHCLTTFRSWFFGFVFCTLESCDILRPQCGNSATGLRFCSISLAFLATEEVGEALDWWVKSWPALQLPQPDTLLANILEDHTSKLFLFEK